MNYLCIFLSIFYVFIFVTSSLADWEYVGKTKKGYELYVDYNSLKMSLGHRYFFGLYNFDKPNSFGTRSVIAYYKLSCVTLMYKSINDKMFKKQMGKGDYRENYKPYENWRKSDNQNFSKIMEEFCRIRS